MASSSAYSRSSPATISLVRAMLAILPRPERRLRTDAVGGDYGLLDDGLFGETKRTCGLPDSVDLCAPHRAALVPRHLCHVPVCRGGQDDLQVHALRRGGQDEANAGLSGDVLRVDVSPDRGYVPKRQVQLCFASRGEHVGVEQALDVGEGGDLLIGGRGVRVRVIQVREVGV